MINQVSNWFGFLGRRLRIPAGARYRVYYCSQSLNAADLERDTIYVVTSHGYKKWAQFQCPCGCGEVILLNLSPSRRPRWQVHKTLFCQATLSPSIWRTEGCRSHFFLRRGKIEWCTGERNGQNAWSESAKTPVLNKSV